MKRGTVQAYSNIHHPVTVTQGVLMSSPSLNNEGHYGFFFFFSLEVAGG